MVTVRIDPVQTEDGEKLKITILGPRPADLGAFYLRPDQADALRRELFMYPIPGHPKEGP